MPLPKRFFPLLSSPLSRFFTSFLFLSTLIFLLILAGTSAKAASATVVISEVMYDPTTAEPGGEWIEVYNLGGMNINLSSYKIGDEETSGASEGMYQFPAGASIAPGQVIIVANSATEFQNNFGFAPDFELQASSGAVPDMVKYSAWASGSIALANSGDEVLLLDENDVLVDSLSWGSSNWAFNPDAPDVAAGNSLERNPANIDTDSAGDWISQNTPAPGTVVVSGPTPTPPPPSATPTQGPTPTASNTPNPSCGKSSAYTAVYEIQGSGDVSPLNNQTVNNVRGIVTADFQFGSGGPQEPRGFFIQAHETDCDSATSDGLFVYSGTSTKSISVGDLIEIDNASVIEYQGPASFVWDLTITELSCTASCSVTTVQTNYGLPSPEEYDPPASDADAAIYNEAREGMLMQVTTDSTVIVPANQYNEFIVLRGLGQDRLHRDDTDTGHLIMVDGDGVSATYCGTDGFGDIRTFDTITYNAVSNIIYGPLNYNFNLYKIQQDDNRSCISATRGDDSSYSPLANPAPAADTNTLTIASMNAYNFFDTSDDPQKSDPIPTQAEYNLKSLKLADAVCQSAGVNRPSIIGFQEVENLTVLQKLAGDINAMCGVSYSPHTLAAPDGRSIEVAFMTRDDTVTVLSVNDRQGCSAINWGVTYQSNDHPADVTCSGGTPYYLFNRPPLELVAEVTLAGQTRSIVVIANHFKSKLSSASCSLPDCTDRRVEQAQHVDALVDGHLNGDPNAYVVVLGDLNDYYNSDPLDALDKTNGVLTNLWDYKSGPPSTGQGSITRYSYIYNGVAQTLDHMLVSDAFNALPLTVSPRHVNADWPASNQSNSTMYASSDHDFLLAAFDFSGQTPTVTPTHTSVPPTATPPAPTPTPPAPTDTPPAPTSTPNPPTPSATPIPSNTPPPPTPTHTPGAATSLHVADLDGSSNNQGKTWTALITILIHDNNSVPVANATVDGIWSNGGSASCTTDGNGVCIISQSGIRKKDGSVDFSVTAVTHASLSYDPAANADPDGDSDGTSITVAKP